MPTTMALIALLSLPLPWGSGHTPTDVHHFDGWTLSVRTDKFSGGRVCRLSRPGVDYQRQAVVLHLSAKIDTTGAVYRIDGGPATLARDDDVELVHLGFTLHNDDLDNPSGGLVRIPVSRLEGASVVRVETQAFHGAAKFNLKGLRSALNAARANGCGAADFQ